MMNDDKSIYREFCKQGKVPVFLTSEWMDYVLPGSWDVVVEQRGGVLYGAWVYAFNKRIISNPPVTPYSGIWFNYPEGQKLTTRLSFEKDVTEKLTGKLPPFIMLEQRFFPSYTWHYPLLRAKMSGMVRYTFVTDPLPEDELFAGLKENIRREIRKAGRSLSVTGVTDVEPLIRLKEKSFKEKKQPLPETADQIRRAGEFVLKTGRGQMLAAVDSTGKVHAQVMLTEDDYYVYYLLGAVDPEQKNSGAISLLLWEGMKIASSAGRKFNFEGSMIPEIERYFRSFGGYPVPYFRINKEKGILPKLLKMLRS